MKEREKLLKYQDVETLQNTFTKEVQLIQTKTKSIANTRDQKKAVEKLMPWIAKELENTLKDLNISNSILSEYHSAVESSETAFEVVKSKVREIVDKSDNLVVLFYNLTNIQKFSVDMPLLTRYMHAVERGDLIMNHVKVKSQLLIDLSEQKYS